MTVTVDDEPRHASPAAVLKPLTSGCGLTLNVDVLPVESTELQVVDVTATEVIVIVVDPVAVRLPNGIANVALPLTKFIDAVSPVAEFDPLRLYVRVYGKPFTRVDELTVTVDDEPRHTSVAEVLKLLTSGLGLTLNVEVLPAETTEPQVVAVTATEVMVIVVEPEAVRLPEGIAKVPLPLVSDNEAVRPVAEFAPLRL